MAIEFETLMLFFVYSLIVGAAIGVYYDVFRIIRIVLPKSLVLIFFEDLIFCVSAGAFMSIFIFNAGFGIVRGYAVIGAGIGFTVYYLTIGKLVYRLSELIIGFLRKALRFIAGLIAAPFVAAAKGLKQLTGYLRRVIRQKLILKSAMDEAAQGFRLCRI